jgi:hypothetical protein
MNYLIYYMHDEGIFYAGAFSIYGHKTEGSYAAEPANKCLAD